MKKSLPLLFLVFTLHAAGQAKFDRVLNIPVTEGANTLHNPWVGGINFPWISSIDLNNDGLLDIYLFDHHNNRTLTFLNNGNTNSSQAWDYAPVYAQQFPPVNKWAFLYDYNCDGKADFFTLSTAFQCTGIMAYKNVSSGGNLQWVIADSCLSESFVTIHENIFASSISLPHFNDIDGDGDMDIIGYNTLPDGRIMYHRNNSMDLYNNCDSLDFTLESMCWGNFQLKIGGTNSVGCFHCPCRVRRPPDDSDMVTTDNPDLQMSLPEPVVDQSEAARRDDTVSSIFALDLDGDNKMELLVGDIMSFNTLMVHNGGTEMDSQDTLFPSNDTSAIFNGFHYHAYLDADNDGLKDLIIMPFDHENKNGLWLYKNSGTNSAPIFHLSSTSFLQNQMIDVGEDACPVLFDYDNDSLLDLVVSKAIYNPVNGSYNTGLYLYKNTGTALQPSFDLITSNFAGLSSSSYNFPIYPAFGDLDNDGDKDMIIGTVDGNLDYYENTGGIPPNFSAPVFKYMRIDIGKYATPQVYDLDRDGLLDIVCGGQRGFIIYFKNRGSSSSPLFDSIPTNDTLGCIVLQATGTTDGYTVPFLYDSLGSTRLLVSNLSGNVFQYDQIDGNLNGCFHQAGKIYNPSESSSYKFNVTVSGGDLNGDNLTDIVIGESTGGVEVRYQHNPFSGIGEVDIIRPSLEIFPNPVKDEMTIRFYHFNSQGSLFRIYNSIGEEVMEKIISSEKTSINTSTWANGIYFVQMLSGKYSLARKIVVRH